jgi:hypothetical protein
MKQIALILLLIAGLQTISHAQRGRPMERIHAAKMAYITDRIKLTADQSAQFVPVYNEYEQELRQIRRAYHNKYKVSDAEQDDMEARRKLEDDLDYQQQVIELKRKYNERFLKVLSGKQVSDMYAAEKEFRTMLLKRLKQRQNRSENR